MRSRLKKNVTPFLFFLLLSLQTFGQQEMKKPLAIKINESIEIDGLLNEPGWKKAVDANELMQFKPEKGNPDYVETTIKILYDDNFIYFGFLCYDPQPDKIEAQVKERDKDLRNDDSVYILIDSLFDRDNFYYFGTNLLGAQFDGRLSLDGQRADVKWDGVWKSASQKTDFGWSIEIAIDLSSLKYEPKKEKTMDLTLSRIVARMPRNIFWEGPLDPAFKVSYLGQLKRLVLLEAVKGTKITPHIVSALEEGDKKWFEWGLDMRYAFSQMVSSHLALNPDFATVESDEERINLSRFELFLPEKRDFFLEGSETYKQPFRLFYSKRIPDIYGGVKLYGWSGGVEFSGMSVQSREDEYTGEDSANFSVLRFKKNIKKSSSIGFLAANKLINGKNIGTAGFDTSFSFSDTFTLAGQFAASYGEYNRNNIAFSLCPIYDSTNFHIHLSYNHLGRNFGDNVNKVGFVRDDNRRELDSGIGITFLKNKGFIDQVKYDSNYNIYWGMDNNMRSWQVDQALTFSFQNRYSLIAHHTQEFKAQDDIIFEEDFRNYRTKFGILFDPEKWKFAVLSFTLGQNFGERFTLLGIKKNLRISRDITVEYELARFYRGHRGPEMNEFIQVIRVNYYFTKDFLIKLFIQSNTIIDKFNIEALVTYWFLPPSGFIQLVGQVGRGRFGEKGTQGNTLFFKINYIF